MLRLHIVSPRRIIIFILDALAAELSWCSIHNCLGLSGQSEVAKPDIAGSHGLPLTGPSMTLTVDRFLIDLLTDRSDPGSMTTLTSTTTMGSLPPTLVTSTI